MGRKGKESIRPAQLRQRWSAPAVWRAGTGGLRCQAVCSVEVGAGDRVDAPRGASAGPRLVRWERGTSCCRMTGRSAAGRGSANVDDAYGSPFHRP